MRALQDVYARVKVRQFDRTFTEIQFLLNTASGSDEHLKRGLKLAGTRARRAEGRNRDRDHSPKAGPAR